MGWIETGVKCQNHPDESQQPGVCSSCLTERLSQISTRSVSTINNYSCSSSSPSSSSPPFYSASYFSASTSPSRRHHHRRGRHHHRHHSVLMNTISNMRSGVDGLKKSRSIAAVAVRKHRVAAAGEVERREKKSGFWSKLIPSTGKRI